MTRLTLEEIGRLAGVSRSTVSRVVNGHPDVSSDVERRVLDVVESTGFRPNRAARSLASSRTGLVGLVIPSDLGELFDDPYFGRLVRGVTRAVNAADQTLALFLFEDRDEEQELYPRVVAHGMVDGLIVTATSMRNPLVARMRDDATPFVMVGRPDSDGVAYVDVENREGARNATAHLLWHGRRELATVTGPANATAAVDRLAGFREAAAEAGVEIPPGRVVEGDFGERRAYEAGLQVLDARPDAVFCASDRTAVGLLRAIEARGLRCPDDVAVTGFDGLIDPTRTSPSLTTVAQPVQRTGEVAVELLLGVLGGDGAPTRRVLPTDLLLRESCGCPSGDAT